MLRLGVLGCCVATALGSTGCADQPAALMGASGSPAAGGSSGAAATTGGSPVAGSGGALATPAGGVSGVAGAGGTAALPGGWFDPAWAKRWRVTVTDPLLAEQLQAFQVPVRLSAQSFDYASAQSKGEDLRFVTPEGVVLKHEVEKWDPVGGS